MKTHYSTWIISTIISLFWGIPAISQVKAITDQGEEVILFNDGTWKYAKQNNSEIQPINLNGTLFQKHPLSSFQVKSTKTSIGVWLNPQKWTFTKNNQGDVKEYDFKLKDADTYGFLITEKIYIPLENLRDIALENARKVAPDLQVLNQEFRIVNNLKVLMVIMTGTIQGMKITYLCYYYSDEKVGSIQFLAFTGQNLFNSMQPEMAEFLNGLHKIIE